MTERVVDSTEWRWVYIAGGLLMIVLCVPLVWAYAAAVPDRLFMGMLVNPLDGISYLAKMDQGYRGSWLFTLPFTPEPHQGVFLFTFYLALGHLARLLALEPVLVFHAARLVGGMVMFILIYRLVADWTDSVDQRRIAWGLAVLGTGLGWVALMVGHVSPDVLLIPEAFPLQAVYANAHFPWAIAIAAGIAHLLVRMVIVERTPLVEASTPIATLALGTLVLVSLSPFVLLPLGMGYVALCVWLWYQQRRLPYREISWGAIMVIVAAPLAFYNAWAISQANPVFAAWMQQNRTPSPPIWDYLIAFGPLLALAAIGLWGSRQRLHTGDVFLLGWLISGAICLYLPLGLQRRFSMGLIIPLAIYGGRGLWRVLALPAPPRWRPAVVILAFLPFLPTLILTIVLPLFGTLSPEQGFLYYITREEAAALEWLGDNTGRDDVVLSSPELGLFLPLYGPRPVYAHPFETLRAVERKRRVEAYYAGRQCSLPRDEGAAFIVVGPRERGLAAGASDRCLPSGSPVFVSPRGEVAVYAADGQ